MSSSEVCRGAKSNDTSLLTIKKLALRGPIRNDVFDTATTTVCNWNTRSCSPPTKSNHNVKAKLSTEHGTQHLANTGESKS